MKIHPGAIVSPDAELADDVEVGAYAIIEGGAKIGAGTVVEPMARVRGGARIGCGCRICSFTTIAGEPQDLHFDASVQSFVEIGDGCVVREGATIHRATLPNSSTKVGRNALIMANSHIAHDCAVGDNFIIGCFSAVAGFASIADFVFVSGGVMVHQKTRIGEGVIISGCSAVSLDVPPFVNAFGRNDMSGINIIGMKRRAIPAESISDVRSLYAAVYADDSVRKNALSAIGANLAKTPEGKRFLEFFTAEGRHYLHPRHSARTARTAY